MCTWVVSPDLDLVQITRKEAVLAHAQVLAIAADEECTHYWAHVAYHALFVRMRRQSVTQLWYFVAFELVVATVDLTVIRI